MLTTVSFDDFMALGGKLEEAAASSNSSSFDWNDFLKANKNPKTAMKYLNACGIKKLGQGSSRAAYALKAGDVASKHVNGQCVLKIATHPTKGPLQNRAEAEMIEKYQRRLECFPRLYGCDQQNWSYILVELGTPFDKTPAKFKKKWLQPLADFFLDYMDRDGYPDVDDPVLDENEMSLKNPIYFGYVVRTISEVLAGEAEQVEDEEYMWYQSLAKNMAKSQIPIVRAISDVFKYAQKHGSREVSLGDLELSANWAFVQRGDDIVLIPIDWGASSEMMKKYYAESISFEWLKKIVFGK